MSTFIISVCAEVGHAERGQEAAPQVQPIEGEVRRERRHQRLALIFCKSSTVVLVAVMPWITLFIALFAELYISAAPQDIEC